MQYVITTNTTMYVFNILLVIRDDMVFDSCICRLIIIQFYMKITSLIPIHHYTPYHDHLVISNIITLKICFLTIVCLTQNVYPSSHCNDILLI